MLPEPQPAPLIPHVEFKAALLLVLTLALIGGFLAYVMYARGVFQSTQRLVLVADDSEGAKVGMDLTFSGFPIGRVQRIELAEDGKARILIDVPSKDARWLRNSTVFTMERGLVGDAHIRAFTGVLDDSPLPDAATRPVLRGDASAEIPRLMATARALLENLERISGADSSLSASLANVQTVTERMKGRHGALAGVLGSEENARKVITALDRSNALLASVGEVSNRLDGIIVKADERVFGAAGMMDETQKAIAQLAAVLRDARDSLKKADAVLAEAQAVGANARAATTDLAALRAPGGRDQPQVAVRARHAAEAAMRALFLVAPLLLAACAGGPVPPDWQGNAQAALRNFSAAHYAGNTRLAAQEFARARAEIAATGRPDLLARAELVRCAALLALAADAGAQERTYADFLAGRWHGLDASLLPAHHRALLAGASDAGALAGIADPMSRLVAAGVLFRMGRLTPAGIAAAAETASANGWRRPLLAWLGVQAQRADAAGDGADAARIRRRIEIVTGNAAAP